MFQSSSPVQCDFIGWIYVICCIESDGMGSVAIIFDSKFTSVDRSLVDSDTIGIFYQKRPHHVYAVVTDTHTWDKSIRTEGWFCRILLRKSR